MGKIFDLVKKEEVRQSGIFTITLASAKLI